MTPPSIVVLLLLGGFVAALGMRALFTTLALRREWALADGREHDMERVSSYLRSEESDAALLPKRAWQDLDMDAVFRRIDRTASWPGQHMLYRRLRREDHSFDSLRQFEASVTRLSDDAALRLRLRTALRPLDHLGASALPRLFQRTLPILPPVARALPLLTVAALACLIAAFWSSTALLVLLGIVASNLIIRVWLGDRIVSVLPAMRMVPAMLAAARTIGGLQVPELAQYGEALRRAEPRLRWVGRAARWLAIDSTTGSEAARALLAYANLLLLLDISAFVWSVGMMRAERETLRDTYEALGELDVAQSVATMRAGAPRWTRPAFRAGPERMLAFRSLVHPLLDDPVPGSLELSGRSMLLTGSNMSGKSTFIRTVGVNALLGRTIHTVFAESWSAPRWAVRTSIGRADSILEGKSYYRAEVDAVGELLAREAREPRIILIDELFRGTNSIERIAAAKAVLAELDRGDDLVIVATHDVELLELLPAYLFYHFREEVRDGQLTFDYALHPGACSTRNALAILELAGYPGTVVDDARRTAEGRTGNG